jgi:D-serine deaminase-like pyridoxal phosphate-dependent protein
MLLPPGITTPALVVDRTRLEHNLRSMADSAAARGIRLRPHAKTHKTAEIGRLQLDMGAAGLTVATIGEAEKFADAGVTDLFIAYPLWPSPPRLARLAGLAERVRLRIGADSAEAAALLAPLSRLVSRPQLLVEVDSGHHRTGVAPGQADGVALAAARAGLDVVGVFTFPGHSYTPGNRERAAADEATALAVASAAVGAAIGAAGMNGGGADGGERSGGSTPTAAVRADPPPTELRPGVYAFNDAQQLGLGVCGGDQIALVAAATVVSRAGPGRFVLDSGSKVLGADSPSWADGFGRLLRWPAARIVGLSEHHATAMLPPGAPGPELGQTVAVIPNHVCAAVNLADELLVTRDGVLVGSWRVMARGMNS